LLDGWHAARRARRPRRLPRRHGRGRGLPGHGRDRALDAAPVPRFLRALLRRGSRLEVRAARTATWSSRATSRGSTSTS
jgi:hypothetical protein